MKPASLTDIVFSVPGCVDISDPAITKAMDPLADALASITGGPVVMSSQASNDLGETYYRVVEERTALIRSVQALIEADQPASLDDLRDVLKPVRHLL